MGPLLIPGAIEYLKTHGTSIQLNLREDTLDRLLPQAQRRELDLLVCRLDATALAAGLAVQPLYRDEMIVVSGPDHPLTLRDHVTWRDASEFPWIAPPQGSPMRVALEAEFAHVGLVMPDIVLESVSHSANCAVAQCIPCLFVSSQRGLTGIRGAGPLHRLPLALFDGFENSWRALFRALQHCCLSGNRGHDRNDGGIGPVLTRHQHNIKVRKNVDKRIISIT
jgi:DNA-binding transcriptional LysR family regulator